MFFSPSRSARARSAFLGLVGGLVAAAPGGLAQILVSPAAADSANVTLLSHLPIEDYDPWVADLWGYAASGREYALVCQGNGLRVIDVTDPTSPVTASLVPAGGTDLKDCKTWLDRAYCALEEGGIQVIDLSDPYAATDEGLFGEPGGYHNVFIDGRGLLYACGHSSSEGFQVYDLRVDPIRPPLVATWGSDYVHDIHVEGPRLLACYIGRGDYELVDVTDPQAPLLLATFTHEGPLAPHSGWIHRSLDFVYTCDETTDGHLIVWDVSNLAAIQIVDEYQVGEGTVVHNVQIQDDLAYVSYYSQGMRVLRIADPAHPVEVGHWAAPGVNDWGVYPHTPSGNVYFNDMTGDQAGLYVARYDRPVVEATEIGPLARAPTLRVWPNPSEGLVHLSTGIDPGRIGGIEIFDATGRRVRTISDRDFRAGLPRATWDGTDEDGIRVPSGIYFAIAGGLRPTRIVLGR